MFPMNVLCQCVFTCRSLSISTLPFLFPFSPPKASGSLTLGVFTGALQAGKVYSGGSSDAFCKYTGAKGKVSSLPTA